MTAVLTTDITVDDFDDSGFDLLPAGTRVIGRVNIDLAARLISADYAHSRPLFAPNADQVFITTYPDGHHFTEFVPVGSLKVHVSAETSAPVRDELIAGLEAGYAEAASNAGPRAGALVTSTFSLGYRAGYIAFMVF